MEGKGGIYLEDCGIAPEAKEGAQARDPGYASYAFNRENEERLWAVAAELVGLKDSQVLRE